MKPMTSSLSALAAIFVLIAPNAFALTCSQQAADLQSQQVHAQEIAETRLALVDEVEAAGDAWEDVEIHRLASTGHADVADQAKAEYEALKADLVEKELALQAMVVTLNNDVSAYNQRCVTD